MLRPHHACATGLVPFRMGCTPCRCLMQSPGSSFPDAALIELQAMLKEDSNGRFGQLRLRVSCPAQQVHMHSCWSSTSSPMQPQAPAQRGSSPAVAFQLAKLLCCVPHGPCYGAGDGLRGVSNAQADDLCSGVLLLMRSPPLCDLHTKKLQMMHSR